MKQQFFVGDSVRICDTPQESTHVDWTDLMDGYAGDIGTVTEVSEYHRSGRLGYVVDDGYYFDAKWLTIVERAWQKNTGKQPVEDGVEVEVKFRSCGKDKLFAGQFRWNFRDSIGDIVEWRIADSISSNKEQPEAIPPSHVALEDNLVQVGGPYMKIWCDTCQGTGEIDETLGGESFSDRDTPCPDCAGNGWWERKVDVVDKFGFGAAADEIIADVSTKQEWTDKHYDNNYTLTQKDIERGFVKIDPYFVSKMWKIGSKDDSGALWHCFKTIARFGEKNSRQREIKALYAQIKCLAEIEEVDLNG